MKLGPIQQPYLALFKMTCNIIPGYRAGTYIKMKIKELSKIYFIYTFI